MFLSLPASLRKAVAFPSRHPPPPRDPFFIYGRRERAAHMASRAGIARVNAARIINSGSITTRNTRHSIAGEISSGAAVFAGQGRWMRSGSGRALPAAAAGLSPRKWVRGRRASNGVLGGKAMGSVHEYRCEEGEVGTNGDHTHQKEHQKHSPSSRLLTLPTVLTLGRVAAVPLFISTFYMNGWWATTATTSIFLAAAITDWLDGYLARKMQLGTAFGAFLDPVADKLMVAATLVLLCTRPLEIVIFGEIPWLLTVPSIAIIGREITMSAVREWAASQNGRVLEAVAVNNLGKWKTATQMIALSILLVTRDSSLRGPGFIGASGVILLYISAGLAVWSLAVYMGKIWSVLLN